MIPSHHLRPTTVGGARARAVSFLVFPAALALAAVAPSALCAQSAARDSARADSARRAAPMPAGMRMHVPKPTPKPTPKPDTTPAPAAPARVDGAPSAVQPPPGARPAAPADVRPSMPMPTTMPTTAPAATASPLADSAPMAPMAPMAGMRDMRAVMIEPLGISMDRMGSGTTWVPDAVTMPAHDRMVGEWDVMTHGFAFAQFNRQRGPRGGRQLGSVNWGMLMASHRLAGGQFQARTMLSLDALGVTPRGYPLLLQTGEQYGGRPLHDRQHPHDLFMELGALYDREVGRGVGVELYVAPSGEPALGPVAFMHRPSAMDDPVAPIGHHWQDATHISFGVLTAGLFTRRWKLEGSAFNGREPDEHRYGFEPVRLGSYSGRVTFNPDEHWSLVGGYGHIRGMERDAPDASLRRLVAAAMHGVSLGADGQWATTAVVGANLEPTGAGGRAWSRSALLESEAVLDRRNTVFGRVELVQKSAADLALGAAAAPDRLFGVASASLAYVRELARAHGGTLGLGVRGTLDLVPRSLEGEYGSRTPAGVLVFLRVRPTHFHSMRDMMSMGAMPRMGGASRLGAVDAAAFPSSRRA